MLKVYEVQKTYSIWQFSLPTSEIYESNFTSFPLLGQQKSVSVQVGQTMQDALSKMPDTA